MSEDLERLIADLMTTENGSSKTVTNEKSRDTNVIPSEVPILPLRGLVVYPHTAIPLTVGQQRSLTLVDDVIEGNRLVGLVTAYDPELETPGPNDIYSVGTLAAIHRLFRAPDGTIRLLVQGLKRIRINEFTAEEPYLKASISEIPELVESELEVEALEVTLKDVTRPYVAPSKKRPVHPG